MTDPVIPEQRPPYTHTDYRYTGALGSSADSIAAFKDLHGHFGEFVKAVAFANNVEAHPADVGGYRAVVYRGDSTPLDNEAPVTVYPTLVLEDDRGHTFAFTGTGLGYEGTGPNAALYILRAAGFTFADSVILSRGAASVGAVHFDREEPINENTIPRL